MRITTWWLLAFACFATNAPAALIRSADGLTVYDTTLHVTWLANANLAATLGFGVAGVGPGGAMDYPTAQTWVAALNAANYLGHSDWQLPAFPTTDPTCNAVGPNGNSFGYNCANSALGSLYLSLGLHNPDTAVPIPPTTTGPFSNFQPYLYWSGTQPLDATKGYFTFSFSTGWHGANVDGHNMYVLPMINGRLPGSPSPSGTGLQRSADGSTVYDPIANVTWLANANLAQSQTFTAQCTNKDGTPCIDRDGSMSHTVAIAWVNALNAAHYLGQTNWQLPPIPEDDPTCSLGNAAGGFQCTGNPMGNLYYNQLHLKQGTPVVAAPAIVSGSPFYNLQPYLYWGCTAAQSNPILCSADVPAPNYGWSYSFGNGFQGTDLQKNALYVMVYYNGTPPPVRHHRATKR